MHTQPYTEHAVGDQPHPRCVFWERAAWDAKPSMKRPSFYESLLPHLQVMPLWKELLKKLLSNFSSVQSLSRVRLFATPRIAARQPPCPYCPKKKYIYISTGKKIVLNIYIYIYIYIHTHTHTLLSFPFVKLQCSKRWGLRICPKQYKDPVH